MHGVEKKTSIKSDSLDPEWEESFAFFVDDKMDRIKLTVLDKGVLVLNFC